MAETGRTPREPIELAETRKGTHLMDAVRVPDGFVAPSAAIVAAPIQASVQASGGASTAPPDGAASQQQSSR